ncbi:MAG: ATP-binding cassette domain-containing protein [Hymenobacter sp.]
MPAHIRLTALSFGQQKKALIAFALATNTGLLVLDEPTNGLDIPSKAQFRKLVAGSLGRSAASSSPPTRCATSTA